MLIKKISPGLDNSRVYSIASFELCLKQATIFRLFLRFMVLETL